MNSIFEKDRAKEDRDLIAKSALRKVAEPTQSHYQALALGDKEYGPAPAAGMPRLVAKGSKLVVVVSYLRSFWANLNRLFYPSNLVFLVCKKKR